MPTPGHHHLPWIRQITGVRAATITETIQTLWSGYGELLRVHLEGAPRSSVVLKSIDPPDAADHPSGWNTDRSHARKLASYEIERTFYRDWSPRCPVRLRRCLGTAADGPTTRLLLEDLDAAGFDRRTSSPTPAQIEAGLRWLAGFHAGFLGAPPTGLWPVGTYWHLATRPDELARTEDPRLRAAAPVLDQQLNACRFQTLVHGDAKIANFCFAGTHHGIAAVDFQYTGGGCGIKDVAYFLSSCMSETECERYAPGYLDCYFAALHDALPSTADAHALETEWRALYPVAWADFYRFLAGWSPDHWKIHSYSDRLTKQVLDALD